MEYITNYGNVLTREGECISEQLETKFHPKNSRRDKKRYKRNIKKVRRAYFKDAVENKTYDSNEFFDKMDEWYSI